MIEKIGETEKTVLILGFGGIGRALLKALRAPGTPVSMVNAADPHVEDAFPVDVLKEPDLIRNYNYVINTIPVHDREQLVPLLIDCIKYGVHYIDTNEDRGVGKFVRLIGEGSHQKDILVAPHSGLAPGFINVLGAQLARTWQPRDLDLRVGALTRFVDNDLLYAPTWSPEGVLNQYGNHFEVVENHKPVVHASIFSRADDVQMGHFQNFMQQFWLDGIHYEAFPTSGGIGTMADLEPKPRSITYRTIRLHGHAAKMMSVFNAHGFKRNAIVGELARYRVLSECLDYVLIIAKADGNPVIIRADAGDYLGIPMTAIQKCTVGGVAAVLDLHIHDKVPNGFLHQHDIDWNDYKQSRFIKAVNYNGL